MLNKLFQYKGDKSYERKNHCGVCERALEDFAKEEKGASDIVAIMLVIVILIAVAAVFRTQLLAAVTGVFEQLMEALGL